MKPNTNKYFLILLSAIAIAAFSCNNSNDSSKSSEEKSVKVQVPQEQSYDNKKTSLADEEKSSPLNFLSIGRTYHKQTLGAKFVLNISITNKATIAAYKDVEISISFYSKTKALIGNESKTYYDYFRPQTTSNYEEKIKAPDETVSIGWEIVHAKAN